ncbi:MAG: helix-turn-helix transcriptional regulator [Gemmobacter sp.]|uniref:helix-turn-helix transcriptional regulator n=1 Tax=Gemmobacter sp. TaxID=1898957 RepID=UPI001A4E38A8|nr:AraC family transcriptional regulator [Gemmobacter sp.]MBL8563536.1 helix-turn-helix transcriptional regulator [Gemmobacter sp.]
MKHLVSPPRPDPALAHALLERLRPFRRTDLSGMAPHGPGLFSYCALTRERLASVRLPHPLLAVVLSGRKEIWRGLDQHCLGPGTLFALPAHVDMEIVNDPDPRSGVYQSLILEVTPEMWGVLPAPPAKSAMGPALPLSPALVEALLHAASAICAGPSAGPIRQARLAELLALLHPVPEASVLFDLPLAARIAQMVRARPELEWQADAVARALGLSPSTLRRRLRAGGESFAALLRRERMAVAARLLAQGLPSGMVAGAVGYASRAHFARAYRAEQGQNPASAPSVLSALAPEKPGQFVAT